MIDGTQAEYVRTPYADNSLVPLPDNVNEEVALLLSDALPTAHESACNTAMSNPATPYSSQAQALSVCPPC